MKNHISPDMNAIALEHLRLKYDATDARIETSLFPSKSRLLASFQRSGCRSRDFASFEVKGETLRQISASFGNMSDAISDDLVARHNEETTAERAAMFPDWMHAQG